ncbi:ATP synthase F0 subunit B [Streptomyces sp. HNM0645]|uniref:ATP synthase F0 subunit B n=1 Tax=Streptomyces sp. HNM0645 TaxID=2782343 RepID=UPI0024B6AB1A|nr:ATP synthase F0 subunit B [Streptomyces sp. HNM0645]MDI9885262.1 ATP synthase F0 subunit B [Streptomyces sp. HNM0645]
MDVQKKLDEIVEAVGNARSMPMSASCVVNRAELLAMLEEVRQALPGSLAQAQELIGDREQMVEQARQEAERIIQAAHSERGSLVSGTHIARQSQEEADRILAEARREAEEIRAEADDYVDSKLANFEVVLNKTIGSVDRGREKLLGRGHGAGDQGHADPADDDAPEYSADPQTLIRSADDYVDAKLGAFEAVLSKTLEAVGRGRQKLHGRIATDELGAHMAAQEVAGSVQHTSDADYLAGLAELADPEPQAPQPQIPAQADPYGYQPAAAQAQPQDMYGYQQDPYAVGYGQQQGYDPAYAQGYGHGQDPYGGGYSAQQQPQQAHQGHAQPASLDETSFFDTSMIDMEQLRRYEQGR